LEKLELLLQRARSGYHLPTVYTWGRYKPKAIKDIMPKLAVMGWIRPYVYPRGVYLNSHLTCDLAISIPDVVTPGK